MLKENRLSPSEFIYPMFVTNGSGIRNPIEPMPGIDQISVDIAVEEAQRAFEIGVKAVLIFGLPEQKDAFGSRASDPAEAVQSAVTEIKGSSPDTYVITDVCLCEYTDHGHCGIIKDEDLDSEATLPLLAKTAISHARAGADMVAPSAMIDGQVATIRSELNENGFNDVPKVGDRSSYQMGFTQSSEAIREIQSDIEEGADIVMVKPALAYLDVIKEASIRFNTPIAAYNVSGEYSMISAAGNSGWIDREKAIMEVLTSIKRAGANLIITYSAIEAAQLLSRG